MDQGIKVKDLNRQAIIAKVKAEAKNFMQIVEADLEEEKEECIISTT